MTAKKVFVTQATGQTGANTVKMLSKASNIEIYAGINKSARMAATHEEMLKTLGNVKTLQLDASSDVDCVAKHLTDVQELFIIPSSTEDKVRNACNYIDAAKKAGVKFVLLLSVLHPDSEGYTWGSQFHKIERYLQESGLPWTIIRSNFYSQYLCLFKKQVENGNLPLPIGNGRFSPVDVADVADFARHILQNPSNYRYTTYDLTGPESLGAKDIANVLSQVLGHRVVHQDCDIEESLKILVDQNVPEQEVLGFRQFFESTKESSPFDTITSVYYKSIMKRDPHSLETTVRLTKNCWMGESE